MSSTGNDTSGTATPAPREKLLPRVAKAFSSTLSKRLLSLCWVTYTLAIVWVFLHPAMTVTTGELKPRGTYMSENALLVDSMDAQASRADERRVQEYHHSYLSIEGLPPSGCGDGDCGPVIDWLLDKLDAIDRVDGYRQRFSSVDHSNRSNVYGILKAAPLADHKESIVLVTHYRNSGKREGGVYSGVAMGLAMLEFLAQAKWLAKDVIVVFADDGPNDGVDGFAPGTEAWLRSYHSDPVVGQRTEDSLPMRAGLIRAAINLETIGDLAHADVVGVFTAGMNGQLPNLDLVNSAVHHARLHSVPVVLDRCQTVQQQWSRSGDHYEATLCGDSLEKAQASALHVVSAYVPVEYRHKVTEYLSNLFGMLRFMKTLATGPSGVHGHFISYNIDAITFAITRSVETQHWQGARSIESVLRSLELLVRSMSNLEEKLHQSFFLYVLPNNHDFVSIGEYYYTVPLAISPAFAHLATTLHRTAGMRVAFALAVALAVELLGVVILGMMVQVSSMASIAVVVTVVTMAQALVLLWLVPVLRRVSLLRGNERAGEWLVKTSEFDKKKSNALQAGDAAVVPTPQVDTQGWRGLKSVLLSLIVFAHCVLGILNYPMALFCALPMAFFSLVEPQPSLVHRPLKKVLTPLLLIASSPLVVFFLSCVLDAAGTYSTLSFVVATFVGRVNLIALPYLCCLYLPVHTLAMAVWLSPTTNPNE